MQVLVGRVAGRGDRNPLADVEGAEKGEVEGGRGAGGDHDALGRHLEAVGFRVVAGDAGAERPQAQRLGVAEMAVGDRGPGGFQHRFRRPRPRLADFHVDDALARLLAVGGRAHDVHDDEGLNIAAARGMRPEAHRCSLPCPSANVLLPPNLPAMPLPRQSVTLTRPPGLPNVFALRQEQPDI